MRCDIRSTFSPLSGLRRPLRRISAHCRRWSTSRDAIAVAGVDVRRMAGELGDVCIGFAGQMVRREEVAVAGRPCGDRPVVGRDVADMLALVELTHPGPFRDARSNWVRSLACASTAVFLRWRANGCGSATTAKSAASALTPRHRGGPRPRVDGASRQPHAASRTDAVPARRKRKRSRDPHVRRAGLRPSARKFPLRDARRT